MFEKITLKKAKDLIEEYKNNPDFVILDIRTPNEFQSGHLEKAQNLDFYADDFKQKVEKLDKTKIYLIYCRSGYRSGIAFEFMQKLGFQHVYDMGGIMG